MHRRSERFDPICHDRSRRVDQESRYPKEGFTIDDGYEDVVEQEFTSFVSRLFLLGSLGLKTNI